MTELPQGLASGLKAVLMAHRPTLLSFFISRTRDPKEAEAILQDVSERLTHAATGPVGDPFGHICRIGLAVALSRARERQARTKVERPLAERRIGERDERIAGALASMPADAAQAFRLHKIEGFSQREVAARLGMKREGVEKHMIVAFRHLAKALAE